MIAFSLQALSKSNIDKGQFFSQNISGVTNRPDAKTQLSVIFFKELGFFRLQIIYSNNRQVASNKSDYSMNFAPNFIFVNDSVAS